VGDPRKGQQRVRDLGYRAGQFPVGSADFFAADLSAFEGRGSRRGRRSRRSREGSNLTADRENIGWLRERLQASLAIEPKGPAELLDWLHARRKDVPFSAELIR
jgi:hypothetical protein